MLEVAAGARPAEFSDDDGLARESCLQLVVNLQGPINSSLLWHALPVRDDVSKDLVYRVAEFRMFDEDSPVFRGPDRNRTLSFHTLNKLNQLGCTVFVPEHRFIAHDQTRDIGIVSREIEG